MRYDNVGLQDLSLFLSCTFRDGVDAAAEAGAKAVIQPGGSIKDEEVIATADEHSMAMIFAGMRHFRH